MNYKNKSYLFLLLTVLYCLLIPTSDAKGTLRIAVASNFLKTAKSLAVTFEKQSTQSIQFSSGSSGKLYLQISHGAPFDMFLSADSQKPHELIKNGYAIADSQQTYAIGKLTLWLKNCPTQTNVAAASMATLTNNDIKKIAIANPKLAPYGQASKKLLELYQLWNELSSKLIYPENIAQVAQLAKLGVIDAALIAESNASLLSIDERSCLVELSSNDYPPIIQQLVIVTSSKNKAAAREFIQFLKSEKAKSLIKNMGYLVPNSARIAQ